MPLTWQDFTGRVEAPDLSDAATMITRGISGIGQSVAELGAAPGQRRKEEGAKQLAMLAAQHQMNQEQAQMAEHLGEILKTDRKEKDIADFGKNESTLLAGARNAALKGISFDEFIASDKTYQSLGDGAKAYAAEHLSNAYMRGDETRRAEAERAADNARNEAHFRMQYALQQQQMALSRQEHEDARAERKAARDAAAALKPKVWKTGNDETDKAMTLLAQRTGAKFNEASGAAYDGIGISEVNKNYPNVDGANAVFNAYNRERLAKHLPILPDGVLKRMLDKSTGTSTSVPGENGWNSIDDGAIRKALEIMADEYDVAYKGKDFYERLSGYVEAGKRPTMKIVDDNYNSMFRDLEKRPAPSPVYLPTTSFAGINK